MTFRNRFVLIAAAALLAACGGDSGTEPPTIDRVAVDPEETALAEIGATAQFQAQALTSAGAPVTGVSFQWSSSNPSVATVDANGRATAQSVGEAFIRASTDGVTGEARLVVRECGEALSLSEGQSIVLDLPAQSECGFILPNAPAGQTFRVALVRTANSTSTADVVDVTLRVTGLGVTGTAPEPAASAFGQDLVRVRAAGLEQALRVAEETERFHLELRERERRMADWLGERLVPAGPAATGGLASAAAVDAPSRLMIDPATPTLCTPAGTPAPALKVAENDLMVIYQDSAQAAGPNAITVAHANRMLDYYAAHGKAIIDLYFGGVSDIDGNGKIAVVAHPTVAGNTAAFVWSGDLVAKSSCPASNEMELIFFNAELIRSMDNGNFQALETVVHEAKHVSSLFKSIVRSNRTGTNAFHPGFIEEGSAEIAGNMSARAAWSTVGGPAPNAKVTDEHIRESAGGNDGNLKPEFYGVAIRLLRTQGYLASQPNAVVVNPLGASPDHSIYGSGWVFLRFLGDAWGGAASAPFADASFFRTQNDSISPAGVQGLVNLTGQTFSQLMTLYTQAVALNGVLAPQPTRHFTSYDFISAIEVFCFAADNPPCNGSEPGPAGTFPWPVTTQSDGTMSRLMTTRNYSGKLGPAGLRYHDFRTNGTGTGAEFVAQAPASSNTKVVVTRLR